MVSTRQVEVIQDDLVHRIGSAGIRNGVVTQQRARTSDRRTGRDVEDARLGDRGRGERRTGADDGTRLVVLRYGSDRFGGHQTGYRIACHREEAAIGATAVVGGRRRGIVRDGQRSGRHREGRADVAHVVIRQAGADRRARRAVVGACVHDRRGGIRDDRAGADRRSRAEGAGRARDCVARGHAVDRSDEPGGRHEAGVLRHTVVGEVRAVGRDRQRRLRDRQARGHGAGHSRNGDARGQQDAHRAVEAVGILRIDPGSRDHVGLLAREDAVARARTGDAVQEIRQREVEVRAVDIEDDLGRAGVVTQARRVRGRGRETRRELVLQGAGGGHAVDRVRGVRRAVDLRQVGAQHHLVGRREAELDRRAGGRTGLRVGRRQVGEVDGRIDQRGRRDVARMVGLGEDGVVERQRAQRAIEVGERGRVSEARTWLAGKKVDVARGRGERVRAHADDLAARARAHRQVGAGGEDDAARAVIGDLGDRQVAAVGSRQDDPAVRILGEDRARRADDGGGAADGADLDRACRGAVGDRHRVDEVTHVRDQVRITVRRIIRDRRRAHDIDGRLTRQRRARDTDGVGGLARAGRIGAARGRDIGAAEIDADGGRTRGHARHGDRPGRRRQGNRPVVDASGHTGTGHRDIADRIDSGVDLRPVGVAG